MTLSRESTQGADKWDAKSGGVTQGGYGQGMSSLLWGTSTGKRCLAQNSRSFNEL